MSTSCATNSTTSHPSHENSPPGTPTDASHPKQPSLGSSAVPAPRSAASTIPCSSSSNPDNYRGGGLFWPTQAYLYARASKRYATYHLTEPTPAHGSIDGVPTVRPATPKEWHQQTRVDIAKASQHALTYHTPWLPRPTRSPPLDSVRLSQEPSTSGRHPTSPHSSSLPSSASRPPTTATSQPVQPSTATVATHYAPIRELRSPSRPVRSAPIGSPPSPHGIPASTRHTAQWHTGGTAIRTRYPGATLSETDLSSAYVLGPRTIRDVLALHNRGVDTTALRSDGTPVRSDTAGILHRRPTHAYGVVLIGKETRRIDRVGILQGPDYITYHHPTLAADPRSAPQSRRGRRPPAPHRHRLRSTDQHRPARHRHGSDAHEGRPRTTDKMARPRPKTRASRQNGEPGSESERRRGHRPLPLHYHDQPTLPFLRRATPRQAQSALPRPLPTSRVPEAPRAPANRLASPRRQVGHHLEVCFLDRAAVACGCGAQL